MADEQTKMEKMLLHAGRLLASTLDYEELMQLVLELTVKAADAEAALVYRIDKKHDDMRVRYYRARDNLIKSFNLPRDEGLIGRVAESREPVLYNDTDSPDKASPRIEEMIETKIKSALVVPLIGRGHMIGVIEAINSSHGKFTGLDLDTLVGLAHQFAVAIDNASLYRRANRKAMEQQLLYEVGKKLSSTLDLDEVLRQILVSLEKVVGFDAGGVFLIHEKKGDVTTVYSQGYEDQQRVLQIKIGQGLVGWVAKTGESVIVPDVAKDERYIAVHPETRSEVVAPIKLNSRILGVFNLESNTTSAYDQNSLDLITAFASQAAISIERAYLHSKMLESKRLDEQLAIARQIQLTFLPKKDPEIAGYDISGINIPSGEVGGDFFDFIDIIDYQTGIAIADVSGKGVPAALLMASYRASLIAEIRNNYSIRTICRKVNSLMYESVEQGNFVTAFYGVLDSKNDIFTFANCGHNQPILIRHTEQIVLLREGGMALGVLPDSEYEERPILLQEGDIILFYTDGVTEAADDSGREFGTDRLVAILRDYKRFPAATILDKIYKNVTDFAAKDHSFDDLTMIILKKL